MLVLYLCVPCLAAEGREEGRVTNGADIVSTVRYCILLQHSPLSAQRYLSKMSMGGVGSGGEEEALR